MKPLLDIDGLHVDFRTPRGRVHALRDVSLGVPRNRIVGIVGESGSGKSTLAWAVMRLLAGNAQIERGAIRFDGRDVLAFSPRALEAYRGSEVSVVFQDPMTSQIPVKSYAEQMVDIAYRRHDLSRAKKIAEATAMLGRVGIPDPALRINQYPHQFSGGMRQRAAIAMALLMRPSLIIADEPTTALDVTMEAQIVHLLKELQADLGTSILVVSHNLGLIAELCDEVVVMYAGEVVEQGDVRRLFYHAAHPYTQALIECDPARVLTVSRTLPTIPGDVPDLTSLPAGCTFADRCPHVFSRCRSERPRLASVLEGHAARCHLIDGAAPRVARPSPRGETHDGKPQAPATAASGVPTLEIDRLRVRFRTMGGIKALMTATSDPHVDAVLDVSLSLRRGETLGLVGESGSGKTTLARAVLGLVPTHSGSVAFEGRHITGLGAGAMKPLRRNMAMMFQDPVGSLSPRMSIRSLLLEPFGIHGVALADPEAEARRLCEMVNLPAEMLSRYPHELSGGQARRVGVARALALKPRLVMADEPTAGLDVSVQGEILNLMRGLQVAHGLGYLIITHNLPVVRHIADRLAIMYLGRIIEQGPCDLVFARPAHPYTHALVEGVPRPDPDRRRTIVSIEGEVPSLSRRPAGCEFHPRCKHATARCRTEPPQSRQIGDGRTVACHFPLTG